MIQGAREIFKKDMKTIKNNPVVLIVLAAIILIPSLYALLNIYATWDPYSTTSNLKLAVANGDSGYDLNGVQYNVGDMLVEELKITINSTGNSLMKKQREMELRMEIIMLLL